MYPVSLKVATLRILNFYPDMYLTTCCLLHVYKLTKCTQLLYPHNTKQVTDPHEYKANQYVRSVKQLFRLSFL